jgi:hypothetical protein
LNDQWRDEVKEGIQNTAGKKKKCPCGRTGKEWSRPYHKMTHSGRNISE